MIRHVLAFGAAVTILASPVAAKKATEAEPVTPASVVAASLPEEWVAIDPADLLVMTLAPDEDGSAREVVIQLMPAPFSQGWVENVRTLAKAHWWDGLSIYRSVDNWVVQWGDGEEEGRDPKPLPEGLNVVPESEYQVNRCGGFHICAPHPVQKSPTKHLNNGYGAQSVIKVGWRLGFDPDGNDAWPVHCYGSVGVARDLSPDTGTGAELYAVIGHAPRQLDRNIAVVGRVIEGMAHLSILSRGTGEYGVYETKAEHTPIVSVRLGNDTGSFPPPTFEYLSTDSESFARYAAVSANRNDAFYKVPAGGIDICNLKVPIRRVASD